jgi:hypothetical protein
MSVLNEALGFLGLAGGSNARNGRYEPGMAKPRKEQRDLAEAMRQLPGRYADRLSARTLQRIIGAAAAGQWENAVNELIAACPRRGGHRRRTRRPARPTGRPDHASSTCRQRGRSALIRQSLPTEPSDHQRPSASGISGALAAEGAQERRSSKLADVTYQRGFRGKREGVGQIPGREGVTIWLPAPRA